MFFKHSQDKKISILIVYVDHIILIGDDVFEMNRLKSSISITFEIKDLGSLRYFLGMEVAKSKKGIMILQKKYILDLLKETRMSGCRPVDTPIGPNQKLCDEKVDRVDSITDRRSTLGYCIYVWGNLVTWRRKKQNMPIHMSMKLYCDNKVAISIAQNLVQHNHTKHVEIDIHFIKEKIEC
ncbi:putative mitochondrial protein, partial [Mucuna pruriens]